MVLIHSYCRLQNSVLFEVCDRLLPNFSKEKWVLFWTDRIIFFTVSRNLSSKLEKKHFDYSFKIMCLLSTIMVIICRLCNFAHVIKIWKSLQKVSQPARTRVCLYVCIYIFTHAQQGPEGSVGVLSSLSMKQEKKWQYRFNIGEALLKTTLQPEASQPHCHSFTFSHFLQVFRFLNVSILW